MSATIDPEAAVGPARRIANSRQHAVANWHPDAGRVDPETWWLAFREGAEYAWRSSARLSGMLQQASEIILMLAQRRCPHCGGRLDDPEPDESERGSAYYGREDLEDLPF